MIYKRIYIITAPLVEWLRKQGFPLREPPIVYYPDGSLWTDDSSALVYQEEQLFGDRTYVVASGFERLISRKLPGAYASCSFRTLATIVDGSHRAVSYNLFYPGACKWLIANEAGVLLCPREFDDVRPEEYDLGHVRVRITFRRAVARGVAKEVAGVARKWFDDIGAKGVFGQGGVQSMSKLMGRTDREVGFEIDARGAGAETLNTLYLAVLNWGMAARRPLMTIELAADPNAACFSSSDSISL